MNRENFRFIFGPVPSRRLGRFLGVSPIPPKTCNFTCIYCQLGRTTSFTNNREEFYPLMEIVDELKDAPKQKIDFGMAEPEPLILMDVKYDFDFNIDSGSLDKLKVGLQDRIIDLKKEGMVYHLITKINE